MPDSSDPGVRGLLVRVAVEDDACRLTARLRTADFAGIGEAWFDCGAVEEFARALQSYPLSGAPELAADRRGPPDGRGAAEDGEEAGGTVALRVYTIGRKGQIGVQARLGMPASEETRPEERGRVEAELLTSHEKLKQFAVDVISILDQRRGEAALLEDRLV